MDEKKFECAILAQSTLAKNIFSAYLSFVFSRSCFETLISVNMAFVTNVDDFQAALNACVSVQDWDNKRIFCCVLMTAKSEYTCIQIR